MALSSWVLGMFLIRGEYEIWNLPMKKIAQDDGMKVLFFLHPGGPGGMYNPLDIGTQLRIIFKYKLQNAMRKHTINIHNT
jgi:hypothetical protein